MGCLLEQTLVGVNVMEEEIIVNQGNVFVHQGVLFLYIAMSKQKMRATSYDHSHMGHSRERRS